MSGPQPSKTVVCRCGVLIQQSWWQEVLENASYRVVRVDHMNPVATIMTISVATEPGTGHPFHLTVADVDWATMLTNFAEPIVTRDGEEGAMLAHEMLAAKLRELLSNQCTATAPHAVTAR
jgi:hypothetical protein